MQLLLKAIIYFPSKRKKKEMNKNDPSTVKRHKWMNFFKLLYGKYGCFMEKSNHCTQALFFMFFSININP